MLFYLEKWWAKDTPVMISWLQSFPYEGKLNLYYLYQAWNPASGFLLANISIFRNNTVLSLPDYVLLCLW